jgi:hypothetical protein
METSNETSSDQHCRRRTFLAGLGTSAVVSGGFLQSDPVQISRTAVIPVVEEFEDNYAGQFLSILDNTPEETPSDVELGACGGQAWPETREMVGQLTSRRAEDPVAVRVPVYFDDSKEPIADNQMFAINEATVCDDGKYVQLDIASMTTRSLVGKAPGPTVSEEDIVNQADTPGSNGAGFGLVAGALGVGGAALLRWLGRD